jgi:hypothetical protein
VIAEHHGNDISCWIQRNCKEPNGQSFVRRFPLPEHHEQTTGGLPIVIHVDGEVAANGDAIALRIVRSGQSPVDMCLRTEDVQYLVSILLTLSCEANRLQAQPEPDAPPRGAIPLPLSAISVGQDDHNQTFMMVEVGRTALMFGLAPGALEEVGRTLLATD